MNKNTFESKRYWIDNINSLSYGYNSFDPNDIA